MRQLNILLISTYELGHQPLALASPLAFLRQAGFAPVAIDTAIEPLTDEQIAWADLVAISVPMHTATRLGITIAKRVRQINPAAHICCYGLYALLNAEYLRPRYADTTIGGEYEGALRELAERLATNTLPPTYDTTQLVRLPFVTPERDSLPPLQQYAAFQRGDTVVPAGYVEATRGCLHTCLHCPITPVYGGRFFAIPRETVLADIRAQVAAGAQHITFGDPDFFNGPTHALRILRAMHQEWPTLTFDATIKVEHLLEYRDLLPELAELGCAFIVSAVESLSDEVLRQLDKGHTRADVVEAFALADTVGIPLRPSLLPFTPWTTLEDYLDLLHFFEENDLLDNVDPVHFSIRLLIPPGSAVLNQPDTAIWLGPLDEEAFTYRWQHHDPRLDQLQQAVAAVVEAGEQAGAAPAEVFEEIKALAYAASGLALPLTHTRSRVTTLRPPVPRLTESWFC